MPAPKRKSENGKTAAAGKKAKGGKEKAEPEETKVYTLQISKGKGDPNQSETGILVSGLMVSEHIGRVRDGVSSQCLFLPHRISGLNSVKIDQIVSHCSAAHAVLISSNNEVFVMGRNENGQLGIGKEGKGTDVQLPTKLDQKLFDDQKISNAACGKGHTLFLSTEGNVFACGDNSQGQLGIGGSLTSMTRPKKLSFEPTVKIVACGQAFSMIVDIAGGLYSFGFSEYGQLGNGSDGKTLGKANKYVFNNALKPERVIRFVMKGENVKEIRDVEDVSIKMVACGYNHTIALDTEGRIFTWGCGFYGRLGHNSTVDEYYPRQIISFLHFKTCEITGIQASSTYTLVSMRHKMMYLCGQIKSSSSAAEMYFKPVMDISGWPVDSIGCANKSILIVADEKAIAWGPSPVYGELALGDGTDGNTKSSANPKIIPTLERFVNKKVACGNMFTIFMVDLSSKKENEEEKRKEFEENVKKFNEFPLYCGFKE